jgi:hypothetical protein
MHNNLEGDFEGDVSEKVSLGGLNNFFTIMVS